MRVGTLVIGCSRSSDVSTTALLSKINKQIIPKYFWGINFLSLPTVITEWKNGFAPCTIRNLIFLGLERPWILQELIVLSQWSSSYRDLQQDVEGYFRKLKGENGFQRYFDFGAKKSMLCFCITCIFHKLFEILFYTMLFFRSFLKRNNDMRHYWKLCACWEVTQLWEDDVSIH